MKPLLENKVIVVTGGAGLLGKEFIKAVVDHGGTGIAADISMETGEKVQADFKKELPAGKTDFFQLDITSQASIETFIGEVTKKYKKIDGLINSAYPRNANYGNKLENVTYNDFCENVNLHLGGYFLVCREFARYFCLQTCGVIINISSIYGVIAPRFEIYDKTAMTLPVEYAVIKSALIHLTRYFTKYYKGQNIRFNCISPGGILDRQDKVFTEKYRNYCMNKGMLQQQDISGAAVFLLSDMAKYINGQNIIVDDGFTL
ncbi:MAG: flagellin modification protein A [Spirochaetes bacterium GWF1_41_5]|nr:MAG: flagellin modification protein A [Spirochaetes bacterium GWF1_41_5]HBE02341.1 flagellin modification protein A [Spirochaetia bacterium]